MMYALVENGVITKYPINLREEFPHTAFPAVMASTCLPENVVEVLPTTPPNVEFNQYEVESSPVFEDSVWKQTWMVIQMTTEEENAVLASAMSNLRATRNVLLIESDWTQLADAPLTFEQRDAWAQYRQELRNLPEIVVTPINVVYPTKPL